MVIISSICLQEGAEVAVDGAGQAESAEDLAANAEREADILAQLTAEEIQDIMDSVFTEMLGGVEVWSIEKNCGFYVFSNTFRKKNVFFLEVWFVYEIFEIMKNDPHLLVKWEVVSPNSRY